MESKFLYSESLLLEYVFRYFKSMVILCDRNLQLLWCNSEFLRMCNIDKLPEGLPLNEWIDDAGLLEIQGLDNEFDRERTLLFSFQGRITPFSCTIMRRNDNFLIVADGKLHSDSGIIEQIGRINHEMANMTRELTRKNAELEKANARIHQLMETDYLTGLASRRSVQSYFSKVVSCFKRTGLSITVIMADLDCFKQVNDLYGHLMGDKVLVNASKLMKKLTRSEDIVGRFGGEEFIIILVGTDKQGGALFAERLRQSAEKMKVAGLPRQVTMSLGVTGFLSTDTIDSAIHRADEALYLSKSQGRNKVVVL